MPVERHIEESMTKKTIIKNARVWTANRDMPWAREVLIDGKTIEKVSDEAIVCPDAEELDLAGKMLIPAFIDSHIHSIWVAKSMWCLLIEKRPYESVEEIMEIVVEHCKEHSKEEEPYIYVYTCPSELMDADNVDRYLIDAYVSDRAVLMCDSSFHRCLANSKMLELMEIDRNTPYNYGATGNYERFDDGTPNGFISERVHEFNGDINKMFDKLNWYPPSESDPKVIEPIFEILKNYGITCIHEGFSENENTLIGVSELEKQGKLKTYFHTMPSIDVTGGDPRKECEAAIRRAFEWSEKYGSEKIVIDSVKLFLDGTNEIGTSAVIEPFISDENDYGKMNVNEDDLTYILERINQEGLSIQIHLVGDRAFRTALNALERAKTAEGKVDREYNSRVTLLHCELTKPEDRLRTAQDNLYINTSPTFNAGLFGDEAKKYLGEERFDSMFAFNEMIRSGAIVNCSSDIVDEEGLPLGNPMYVIQAGHLRRLSSEEPIRPLAEEKMDIEDLLIGYTINNAKGVGRDESIGSIEEGKLANLCVLSDDPFEVDEDRIAEIEVEKVFFEGELIKQ